MARKIGTKLEIKSKKNIEIKSILSKNYYGCFPNIAAKIPTVVSLTSVAMKRGKSGKPLSQTFYFYFGSNRKPARRASLAPSLRIGYSLPTRPRGFLVRPTMGYYEAFKSNYLAAQLRILL
jgi:hypothetical protein